MGYTYQLSRGPFDPPPPQAPAEDEAFTNDAGEWQLGASDDWHTTTDGRNLRIYDDENDLRVAIDPLNSLRIYDAETKAILFLLDIGNKVLVFSPGGLSAFAVYDDGSVHIKTGASVVADL